MKVIFLTRRSDHQLNSNPLITVMRPQDYNVFEHLLKDGKCKVKSPWSYSDWYVLSYDIETKGEPIGGQVLLSAFCNDGENVLVLDSTSVDSSEIFTPELLKYCFFVAHNADFEARWGVVRNFIPGRYGCTLVNSKRLLSGQEGFRHDIISCINRHLSYTEVPVWMEKDIREQFATTEFLTDEQILYNAADTILLKKLYFKQLEQAAANNQLFLFGTINSRLIIPIAEAEVTGIRHDTNKWLEIAEERKQKADQICQELNRTVIGQYGLNPGTINPEIRKKEESQKKKLEKAEVRRLKLEAGLKALEEKGKTHLKSYRTQQEQLQKVIALSASSSTQDNALTQDTASALINWASPQQVKKVFQGVNCPIPQAKDKKTKMMKDGFGKEARALWFNANPDSEFVTLMKTFDKFKKTEHNIKSFGVNWVQQYVRDGRAFTLLDQAGTATGRFSSGDKTKDKKRRKYCNMQQIPSRGDDKIYRTCFISDDGMRLITLDYSNCEGVIMSSLSGDLNLMRIIKIPDSHSYLGTKCWRNIYQHRFKQTGDPKWKELAETYEMNNVDAERKKERDIFKNSGGLFPTVYGVGSTKVAATSKIPEVEGQIIIDTIKAEVPVVIPWAEKQASFAAKNGYAIHNNRTNSRRWFTPVIDYIKYGYKPTKSQLAEVEFAARNTAIQGTNSDIMKEAIIMLALYTKLTRKLIQFLLTVHDELVLQSKAEEAEEIKHKAEQIMIRAAKHYLIPEVNMEVDGRVETHWKK
jgi:DNA polymerase I-like protein with 3'-5' exonuclease and polymerase domains